MTAGPHETARGGRSSTEEIRDYLDLAKSGKPTVGDYAAAAEAYWTKFYFARPPEAVMLAFRDADTTEEARDAFQAAIGDAVETPQEAIAAAEGLEEIAQARAAARLATLNETFGGDVENALRALDRATEDIDEDTELSRIRDLIIARTYGGGTADGPELERLRELVLSGAYGGAETADETPAALLIKLADVERAITVKVDELTVNPDSLASGLAEQIGAGAPDVPEAVRRELPFIGGLPDATTVTDPEEDPIFTPAGIPDEVRPYESIGSFPEAEFLQGQPGINSPQTFQRTNQEFKQRYRAGFEWQPASWDPTQTVTLKNRLITAGYLSPDNTSTTGSTRGSWGGAEATAFSDLLYESNAIGITWDTQLQIVEADPSASARKAQQGSGRTTQARAPFVAPAYLAPDMDVLKQAVKDSVRGKLGREPTDAEMQQLIGGLDSDYRSAYDVQVQASRSEYDATGRAIDTGQEQAGGTFRAVDPGASFAERFELKFDNELAFKKRREDLNTRQAYADATTNMIDSMVGSS